MSRFMSGHRFVWLFIMFCLAEFVSASDDPLCAVVVIKIEQEVAFERQGFLAKMEISNALEGIDLKNVNVDVVFTDANGNSVQATSDTSSGSAEFFITVDSMRGVNDVNGAGTIASGDVAKIEWLIIPTQNAVGDSPVGQLYFVGASLSYTYGGKQDQINVAPDSIVVKPLPDIEMEYFLTREVIGNDAFTDVVEPPVPYTLGLRVANRGFGSAPNFTVESAQPEIIDNELGLAIGFSIKGSYVNDEPATGSLLVNLGDVQGHSISTARWIMETSLSGRFIDIKAEYSHAEALGGDLTSLIGAVTAHLLVRDVRVQLPGRDNNRDFLVEKAGSFYVYESEMTGVDQPVCRDCLLVGFYSEAGLSPAGTSGSFSTYTLAVTDPDPTRPAYIKAIDPYLGGRDILSVRRNDGVTLHQDNFWIAQERAEDNIQFDYSVAIFDAQPGHVYEIVFTDKMQAEVPPVFMPINPVVVTEGGLVGFMVRAFDPNGDAFTLTGVRIPYGASFMLDSPEQGVFQWQTTAGMAGYYLAVFEADDGVGASQLVVPIMVLAESEEPDNDGTDSDGDGFTDYEEWLAGSDPNDPESTPLTVARLLYGESTERDVAQRGVALSSNERFLFASEDGGGLNLYRRNVLDGRLQHAEHYPDALPAHESHRLFVPPSGQYLYALSESGVAAFRVSALTGELEALNRWEAEEDSSALSSPLRLIPSDLLISSDGLHLYLVANNNALLELEHDEGGFLRLAQVLVLDEVLSLQGATESNDNKIAAVLLSADEDAVILATDNTLYALPRTASGVSFSILDSMSLLSGDEAPADAINNLHQRAESDEILVAYQGGSASLVEWQGDSFASLKPPQKEVRLPVIGMSSNGLLAYSRLGEDGLHVYALTETDVVVTRDSISDGAPDAAGNMAESLQGIAQLAISKEGRDVYVATVESTAVTRLYHDRVMASDDGFLPPNEDGSDDDEGDGPGDGGPVDPDDPAGPGNGDDGDGGSDGEDGDGGAITPDKRRHFLFGEVIEVGAPLYGVVLGFYERFLYAADAKGRIHVYQRDQANGALTRVQEYDGVGKGEQPLQLYVSAEGSYLYAVSDRAHGSLTTYKIDSLSGELTLLSHFEGSPRGGGIGNAVIAMSTDERHVLALGQRDQLLEFRHGEEGRLELVKTLDLEQLIGRKAVSRWQAVALTAQDEVLVLAVGGNLYALPRNQEEGVEARLLAGGAMEYDPDDRNSRVYSLLSVAADGSLLISYNASSKVMRLNWVGGGFEVLKPSQHLDSHGALVAVSHDGERAYSMAGADRIHAYSLLGEAVLDDLQTLINGELDGAGNLIEKLDNPKQMAISRDGRDVYVAVAGGRAIVRLLMGDVTP